MSSVDPLPALDESLELRHSHSQAERDGAAREAARRALARAATEQADEARAAAARLEAAQRPPSRWRAVAAAGAVLVLGAGTVSIAVRGTGNTVSTANAGEDTNIEAARAGATAATTPEPAARVATGGATGVGGTGGAPSPAVDTAEHGAVYEGGHVTLRGIVPNRAMADALLAKAVAVVGAANVTDNYVIDPSAPSDVDGRVRIADPVLFRTGSAELDPRYAPLLDAGAILMALNPKVVLQVVGHTDSTGSDETNLALSIARAQAVVDHVKAKGGFDDARFVVRGVGASQPIADNATAGGRTANRRIEVTILGLLDPTIN